MDETNSSLDNENNSNDNEITLEFPTSGVKIICLKCMVSFSAKRNFYRHQRRIHALTLENKQILSQICPLCEEKKRSIADIQNHIIDHHKEINLKFENKTFKTDDEFRDWKFAIEKATSSYFITKRKSSERRNKVVSYYECNRNGAPKYISESKRIRRPKFSGSVKMGKTCPATMKVTKEVNGGNKDIIVVFQSTHVGHEQKVKSNVQKKRYNFSTKMNLHSKENDLDKGEFTIAVDESKEQQTLEKSIIESTSKEVTCTQCRSSFSTKHNFRRHQKQFHPEKEIFIPKNKICPVCEEKKRTLADIQNHITDHHKEINLKFENKTFQTHAEFKDWKTAFEKDTSSCYPLRGSYHRNNKVVLYYGCIRSGSLNESEVVERSKISGYVKAGKICPAAIKVTKVKNEGWKDVVVEIQSTHVGHEQNVECLRLPKRKRRSGSAGMQKSKTPTIVTLDNVQKTCYNFSEQINELDDESSNANDWDEGEITIAADEYEEQQESVNSVLVYHQIPRVDINAQKASLASRLQCLAYKIHGLQTSDDLDSAAEHIKSLEVLMQACSL